MSDNRRKFTLYLHPEEANNDAQAISVIDTVSRRSRGDLFRQAFVAGLALQQLDERLPALIATMLTTTLTADQVIGLIAQTTGWKPSQASIKEVMSVIQREGGLKPVAEMLGSDPEQARKEAIQSAKKKMSGFM
ncbi:plasmid partitioning/stability family protein [Yersinia ruckeri]|uniref:plasmid partitioning/stability family protein n=1 Tax=Yersinia ruckeri TaxID=29486 RepID=UPI001392329B|nr:plasmid partitioning/stability family protein [Yersinia ruckeri]MCK8540606.1 plasmid partitioning/stability family protein [Yersinia ruckeri]MCK8572663.1 plasmid partitioning/stability family protein [Yersinia ruckeri]MCK8576106.1 plasmid partitioning/stability family protein [Yersinia ruckeri]MCK8578899.1 plasmid partitioning/stability family protein [Yersinia ruckeri]MCK8582652.1 plasmid partitioning/stability family protein [Yersinia ruckeri]